MTWPSPKEELGWGGCFADESDDLKRKFEVEFGGDEARFYKHWPQGFRWTCCGTDAGMKWGCDHHGTGSKPCSCDFCRCVQWSRSFHWSWSLSFFQGWESRYRTASTRNVVRLDMASSFCAVPIHARSILGSLRYQLWHDLRWVWRCEIFSTWVRSRGRWAEQDGLCIVVGTDLYFFFVDSLKYLRVGFEFWMHFGYCLSSNLPYYRFANLNTTRGMCMDVYFEILKIR